MFQFLHLTLTLKHFEIRNKTKKSFFIYFLFNYFHKFSIKDRLQAIKDTKINSTSFQPTQVHQSKLKNARGRSEIIKNSENLLKNNSKKKMLMLNRKIFLILLILSSLVLVLFVLWTSFSFKDRGFRQGEFVNQHPKI